MEQSPHLQNVMIIIAFLINCNCFCLQESSPDSEIYMHFFYRTFQRECPFSLKLSCSRDGQVLAVWSVVNEHNHEISEVMSYNTYTASYL